MSEDLRVGRRRNRYFIANRGSDSEGGSDEEFSDRRRLPSPAYHGLHPPHPSNSPHYPPILTTDFAPKHTQDFSSHPSLSSPSSASSQAADESTPPPATPGSTLSLPPSSSPPVPIKLPQQPHESIPYTERHNSGDNLQPSRAKHYMTRLFDRGAQRAPVDSSSLGRRPRTSPGVSTTEPQPSSSYTSTTSAMLHLDGLLICVSTDSDPDRLNIVPLSGVKSAASIRESIYQGSKLPDDDQAHYSIYRTEIGSKAVGEPLSDEHLHELIRTQADPKGSLKFFVSRSPKARDLTPKFPTPLNIDQTSLPPPVGPLRLNMKRHHSRSRQGSLSSSTGEQPAELGYDADGESQKPSHRQLASSHNNALPPSPRRRPGQIPPMQPPPLPHTITNGQPPSPIGLPHAFKPPTPPTTTNDRSALPNTPLAGQTPNFTDKYGVVRPVPGPPPAPPVSPRRSDTFEEAAPFRIHQRSGSDAGAERDILLKKTEQQMDSYTAQMRNKDLPPPMSSGRNFREGFNPRRKQSAAEEDGTWIVVNDASHYPHESYPQTQLRDPPRASPTSLSRSPRGQNPRFYPSRGSSASQSKQPVSNITTSSDVRPSMNRSGTKPLPINTVMVAWKGEEYRSSGSKGLGNKSATKSMDNLRRRNSPASSYQSSRPNAPSYQIPAVPKFDQSPRTFRPLPVQRSPHPSSTEFASGSSSSISHVQQYPRSTAYPSSTTTPTFMSTDPFPRPQSAADSPMSPTYRSRPLQSPTYGPTLTSGESARSPRAVSPNRMAGPRPLPTHSNFSDRSSMSGPDTSTSTPPRTPISPASSHYSNAEKPSLFVEPQSPATDSGTYISTARSSELTLRQGDNAKFAELLKGVNAMMSRDNLNQAYNDTSDISIAVDDNSSDYEGDGGTWQVPLNRPPSTRPELAPLRTDLDLKASSSSRGQQDQIQQQYQQAQQQQQFANSTRPLGPQLRPSSSRRPSDAPLQTNKNHHHRVSTFTDDGPRPLPEDVYERLEDFFPGHDLDKPVIEANSGGNSPTNSEPVAPLPPPPTVQPEHGYRLRSTKKSIRLVAEEHKRKINDRTSRADMSQVQSAALRKRNTKMWGSKLEEVSTTQARNLANVIPESPSGGPTTFKWVRGELIGKGTYGKVYLAMNATTGEMIAVKQVDNPQTPSDKSDSRQATVVQALKMEGETLRDLDHPHVVQYLGYEETPTNISIFLEYVPGGSIGSVLHKHGKFDEYVVRSFTWQILDGLEYLHSKGVLHRDLKADNILVEMTGICKITDFGISKRMDDIYGGAHTAMQGTVFWMAPEVINTQKGGYNFKIDIWSVGCVVLEMWGGRRPWTGQEMIAVMFKLYQAKLPPPVPDDVTLSELADDFRLKCFAINPDERASAAELKGHPYLILPPNWHFTSFTSSDPDLI